MKCRNIELWIFVFLCETKNSFSLGVGGLRSRSLHANQTNDKLMWKRSFFFQVDVLGTLSSCCMSHTGKHKYINSGENNVLKAKAHIIFALREDFRRFIYIHPDYKKKTLSQTPLNLFFPSIWFAFEAKPSSSSKSIYRRSNDTKYPPNDRPDLGQTNNFLCFQKRRRALELVHGDINSDKLVWGIIYFIVR